MTGKDCFELPSKLDKSYKYIINHDYDNFWKQQNIEPEPSGEFKDLFVHMVDTDPEKRLKLEEIKGSKWLEAYEKKSKDEKEKIEEGLYEEFLKRENKIIKSTQKTIKCAEKYNEIGGSNKGMEEEEDGPFDENNRIRKFKFGQIVEFT